jgi:hypothetical protein
MERDSTTFCCIQIYVTMAFLFVVHAIQKALDDANLSGSDLSAVCVTIPRHGLCLRGIISLTGYIVCSSPFSPLWAVKMSIGSIELDSILLGLAISYFSFVLAS